MCVSNRAYGKKLITIFIVIINKILKIRNGDRSENVSYLRFVFIVGKYIYTID